VLQCVAVRCSALQCAADCITHTARLHVTRGKTSIEFVAVCSRVLQRVLKCVEVFDMTLRYLITRRLRVTSGKTMISAACCSVLQCVAVCCSLYHTFCASACHERQDISTVCCRV